MTICFCILRGRVLDSVRQRAPRLFQSTRSWLSGTTPHYWWDDPADDARRIRASSGVDQGCPLSPALFAIGGAMPPGGPEGVEGRSRGPAPAACSRARRPASWPPRACRGRARRGDRQAHGPGQPAAPGGTVQAALPSQAGSRAADGLAHGPGRAQRPRGPAAGFGSSSGEPCNPSA
ncbi:unnamed protein product [Prorocentrum cordatum]|uniref:Reverse transcriptase domain-containing protein n=1 Tax=Prorocentrum cordatum TaxID=2364126 RepID=A0ABN9TPI5_9DINO|nr:unnamed protein product [Polarella glacialis]